MLRRARGTGSSAGDPAEAAHPVLQRHVGCAPVEGAAGATRLTAVERPLRVPDRARRVLAPELRAGHADTFAKRAPLQRSAAAIMDRPFGPSQFGATDPRPAPIPSLPAERATGTAVARRRVLLGPRSA